MRWVALLAMLLLAPTAFAAQAFVQSPVGVGAPVQMSCTVVLTNRTFEDCRFEGPLVAASHARIVLFGDVSASFRLDDDTTKRQGGQGSCATSTCTIPLNYGVTGAAFLTFKVGGALGSVANIEITREKI